MADAGFRQFLRHAARDMRSHPTSVERALWWRLRDRKLGGLKFRRQRPEGKYIADFVCLEAKLIVEVDGVQHEGSIGDRQRTAALKRMGFDVIRFSNDEAARSRCGVWKDLAHSQERGRCAAVNLLPSLGEGARERADEG